ncbi:MAG: hypothetical protein WDW38_000174 [Sanguina aurantia]
MQAFSAVKEQTVLGLLSAYSPLTFDSTNTSFIQQNHIVNAHTELWMVQRSEGSTAPSLELGLSKDTYVSSIKVDGKDVYPPRYYLTDSKIILCALPSGESFTVEVETTTKALKTSRLQGFPNFKDDTLAEVCARQAAWASIRNYP